MTDFEFLEMDRKQKIQSVIHKYGEEAFYISFSGGRDSTILSAFIDICLPGNRIPRVFANTGIEMNEIVKFVKQKADEDDRIVIIKPSVKIKQALDRDGYPFKSKSFAQKYPIYQKYGLECKTIKTFFAGKSDRCCPERLKYIFTPWFEENIGLKISDKCCENMKEKPLRAYEKEAKRAPIIALLAEEGGRRAMAEGCLFFTKSNKLRSFTPFRPVPNKFLDYLADKYHIKLCKLYYPPFNFKRTGCKGCPFAIHLQDDLDTLHRYFPEEEKQAEAIWKPVYEEYRRIGYRLRPKTGQMDIWDFQREESNE